MYWNKYFSGQRWNFSSSSLLNITNNTRAQSLFFLKALHCRPAEWPFFVKQISNENCGFAQAHSIAMQSMSNRQFQTLSNYQTLDIEKVVKSFCQIFNRNFPLHCT